jgi:hypothetical protein
MQRIKGPPGGTAEVQRDAVTLQDLIAQWSFYDEALGIIWENRLSYLAGRPKQLVFLTDEGPDSDPFRSDDDPEWIRELKRYTTSADATTRDEAREILRSEEWQHMNRIERNIEPIRYELDKKIEEKNKSWNTDVAQARGEGKPHMRGGGAPTDDQHNIYKRISAEAYSSSPEATIDGYSLVSSTPTLKVYKKGDHVIVGVRGTDPTDINDLSADASIAFNRLGRTNRARIDIAAVEALRKQYPTAVFAGAGHSLGGAVIDEMIKRGLLQSARSYNPAVQLSNETEANARVYNENDPLYLVGKQFLKTTPTVLAGIPGTNPHFLDSLAGSGHHMHAGSMVTDGRNRRYGRMRGGMFARKLLCDNRFIAHKNECTIQSLRALQAHYPDKPFIGYVGERARLRQPEINQNVGLYLKSAPGKSFNVKGDSTSSALNDEQHAVNRRFHDGMRYILENGTSGLVDFEGHIAAIVSEPDGHGGKRLVMFDPKQHDKLQSSTNRSKLAETYDNSVRPFTLDDARTIPSFMRAVYEKYGNGSLRFEGLEVFSTKIDHDDLADKLARDKIVLSAHGYARPSDFKWPAGKLESKIIEVRKKNVDEALQQRDFWVSKLEQLTDELQSISDQTNWRRLNDSDTWEAARERGKKREAELRHELIPAARINITNANDFLEVVRSAAGPRTEVFPLDEDEEAAAVVDQFAREEAAQEERDKLDRYRKSLEADPEKLEAYLKKLAEELVDEYNPPQ